LTCVSKVDCGPALSGACTPRQCSEAHLAGVAVRCLVEHQRVAVWRLVGGLPMGSPHETRYASRLRCGPRRSTAMTALRSSVRADGTGDCPRHVSLASDQTLCDARGSGTVSLGTWSACSGFDASVMIHRGGGVWRARVDTRRPPVAFVWVGIRPARVVCRGRWRTHQATPQLIAPPLGSPVPVQPQGCGLLRDRRAVLARDFGRAYRDGVYLARRRDCGGLSAPVLGVAGLPSRRARCDGAEALRLLLAPHPGCHPLAHAAVLLVCGSGITQARNGAARTRCSEDKRRGCGRVNRDPCVQGLKTPSAVFGMMTPFDRMCGPVPPTAASGHRRRVRHVRQHRSTKGERTFLGWADAGGAHAPRGFVRRVSAQGVPRSSAQNAPLRCRSRSLEPSLAAKIGAGAPVRRGGRVHRGLMGLSEGNRARLLLARLTFHPTDVLMGVAVRGAAPEQRGVAWARGLRHPDFRGERRLPAAPLHGVAVLTPVDLRRGHGCRIGDHRHAVTPVGWATA
jgi:hypothetical protein